MSDEARLREEVCEVGRRLYARGYVAGNDGNISVRLDDQRVLCTPTMICKGHMRPEDLCIVDLAGRQLAGPRPRTSEILVHLQVLRLNPKVRATVHAHPPYATAFAVAHEPIPTGILPEVEVFLGVVPRTPYETPGTAEFARQVEPHAASACSLLLSNHGTLSWGESLERANWNTEILDSYCRILLLAKLLGNVERLPAEKVRALLALKEQMGLGTDPRAAGGDDALFVNPAYGRPAHRGQSNNVTR